MAKQFVIVIFVICCLIGLAWGSTEEVHVEAVSMVSEAIEAKAEAQAEEDIAEAEVVEIEAEAEDEIQELENGLETTQKEPKKLVSAGPAPVYKGCYEDNHKQNRVFPYQHKKKVGSFMVSGSTKTAVEQCRDLAMSVGHNVFALEFKTECWSGYNVEYAELGKEQDKSNCPPGGGNLSMQVYTVAIPATQEKAAAQKRASLQQRQINDAERKRIEEERKARDAAIRKHTKQMHERELTYRATLEHSQSMVDRAKRRQYHADTKAKEASFKAKMWAREAKYTKQRAHRDLKLQETQQSQARAADKLAQAKRAELKQAKARARQARLAAFRATQADKSKTTKAVEVAARKVSKAEAAFSQADQAARAQRLAAQQAKWKADQSTKTHRSAAKTARAAAKVEALANKNMRLAQKNYKLRVAKLKTLKARHGAGTKKRNNEIKALRLTQHKRTAMQQAKVTKVLADKAQREHKQAKARADQLQAKATAANQASKKAKRDSDKAKDTAQATRLSMQQWAHKAKRAKQQFAHKQAAAANTKQKLAKVSKKATEAEREAAASKARLVEAKKEYQASFARKRVLAGKTSTVVHRGRVSA